MPPAASEEKGVLVLSDPRLFSPPFVLFQLHINSQLTYLIRCLMRSGTNQIYWYESAKHLAKNRQRYPRTQRRKLHAAL